LALSAAEPARAVVPGVVECSPQWLCWEVSGWVCEGPDGGYSLNKCNVVGGPFEEECGWN
jgi:hypothetical protein